MEESILKFNTQFDFEPVIENSENLKTFDHIVFCAMGGSHLSADIIKTIRPGIDIYVHKDYNLPPYNDDFLNRALLVACSYSGNTEEVLSFVKESLDKELSVAVISKGGELLEIAKEKELPYIEIPDDGMQPRMAVGYMAIAISKLLDDEDLISNLNLLGSKLKPLDLKEKAVELLDLIENKILVVYSSTRNLCIANNWKIKLNETAKIPAFYNIFPELNHNEMQGFDLDDDYRDLFSVIFLFDSEDSAQIQQRMEITKDLYNEKGINTVEFNIGGKTREENVFNALLTADWLALELANRRNKEPEQVPMIEEFKERMRS